MKKIERGEAEEFQHGETCIVLEYSLGEKMIDAPIVKINGPYPDEGWVMNRTV